MSLLHGRRNLYYLFCAVPKGEPIASVERHEQRAIADSHGHAFLDSGRIGAVKVLGVALELDLLGVEGGHCSNTAQNLWSRMEYAARFEKNESEPPRGQTALS